MYAMRSWSFDISPDWYLSTFTCVCGHPLKDSFEMRFTLNSRLQLYIVNIWNWITYERVKVFKYLLSLIEYHLSLHIGITDIHDFVNIVTRASKKIIFLFLKRWDGEEKIEKYQISGQHSCLILFYLLKNFFYID